MQKTALCDRNIVVPFMVSCSPPLKTAPQLLRFLPKTLLIMKLTILFLAVGLFSAHAEGLSQTITFSGKDVPLAKVFTAIEKQTGYNIFANKGLLKEIKPVSLSAKDMPLKEFLDAALRNQPIDYEINNRTIFIKKKPAAFFRTENANLPVLKPDPPLEITGTVLAPEGTPLEGATVTVKGTTISTSTNADGRFTINADPGQTLVISFVGYQTVEERVVSGRTAISITLEKAVGEIEQVVVTALGITRRTRTLTYNVQEIKGDDISRVNNGNFVNSLVGKVAGATINSSSAGTGSSSRVVLRGTKSILNNNNALYVIDGIPMPNIIRGQADDIFSGAGQTGDFAANLNPEDIESLSVLSGPAAAALYGSAAANGVIIVTTKKGQKNRTDISIGNTTTFMDPLMLPKFQRTYGVSEVGSYYSWGDKLVTPSTYHPKDFFQTGVNSTTSVTISTGTDQNQTYVSFGDMTAKGIIPNNEFGRRNFTVRNTSAFLKGKMTFDIGFMGSLVKEQNMISQGQYFNPLVAVYLFPAGDDFDKVKAFERYDPSRNLMTQWWSYGDNGLMMQNPYWVTQRDLFPNKKERYMTTASLRYALADWITLSGRAKMDKFNEKYERRFAASTNQLFASENGYYSLTTVDNRQIYAEGLATINKTFNNKYNITANIGGAIEDNVYNEYSFGGKLQGVANLYTYRNINALTAEWNQVGHHRQKQSVFGSMQFGYNNMLFLDVTGRNDWASTLGGTGNVGFAYPSVGLSGIITDLLPIRSNTLSYLKLRASYSEVGNEPQIYMIIPTYPLATGNAVLSTRMPNPDIQAELTKSWEAGFNAALFKGALRLDATVYSSRTYNQFFDLQISGGASGTERVYVNGGRVDNKGIEASLRYSHRFGSLEWNSYATYSLNKNKVVRLLPEGWINPVTKELVVWTEQDLTGTGSYKMRLTEGGSMGDIYVNTLRVDEHGAIYVDPGSQTVIGEPNNFVFAGNSNPKYNLGWGNTFTWKGLSLNFLFTGRVGGIVVSNTQAIMDAFGASQASADARDAGGALVNGRPVPAKEYYQVVGTGASGGIASMYVYSATNVRLAEASLGYDIPLKRSLRFVKSANISLTGRNLLMLYNSAPFDPELTANTQTFFQGIDYFMMPSLRSVGFSVKFNF